MLEHVEDLLPAGGYEWEQVAARYNAARKAWMTERDDVACKRKFALLKNVKKPTGIPRDVCIRLCA
jgi:hypothetical protein